MKSFLHSRALGCSVGVAIPVHEQHHWLLSLRTCLSCSVYRFYFVPLSQCLSSPCCSGEEERLSCVPVSLHSKLIRLLEICQTCNQLKCSKCPSIHAWTVLPLTRSCRVPKSIPHLSIENPFEPWTLLRSARANLRWPQHASRVWNCIFVFYICSLTRCEHIVSSVTYQK